MGGAAYRINVQAISICLTLVYFAVACFSISSYREELEKSEVESIKRAIERAAVQCYALEGHYPPDLEYLEENYGIRINRAKYHCEYFVFASNVRPHINVIKKVGSK
ncbi:MAG: hypothetical protein ACOX35_05970 [Bacillota bacterium]|jgi:hypothetical protein|nr:hypothetical protein [Candidatus Fermentithermobacillaceae bacterium]